MITASVPTKIILIGEHAVVYGIAAISLPIRLSTTVSVQQQETGGIHLSSNVLLTSADEQKLKKQVQVILQSLGQATNPNIALQIKLSVPPGIGFGVSASVAVALVQVLYKLYNLYKTEIPQKKLFELVAQLEKQNHGKPSSIDHTTIILDTPLLFYSKEKYETLQIQENEIFQNCYLIHTGKPQETTKEMVEFVATRHTELPRETKILFQKINIMVPIVISALKRGGVDVFRDILNEAGMVLEQLGVVSESVMRLSQKIRENGGMAKISGAGGRKTASGILLVWHPELAFVEKICQENGFECWPLR